MLGKDLTSEQVYPWHRTSVGRFHGMVKSRRGKEKETAPSEDVVVGPKRARRGIGVEIRETPLDAFV
ncbi:hypothetical protein Hanom_Chr12g01119391 [Helianthus anomalus]